MYIVDMHCDTSGKVFLGESFVNEYNFSRKYPQLQFAAMFDKSAKNSTPEERRAYSVECEGRLTAAFEREGIGRVFAASDIGAAKRSVILSIEGGGGLFADSPELNRLYERGLRVFGIAWDGNELAASAYDENDTGLTEAGVKMVKRLSELGIIIDVSHLSDRSFYDVLNVTDSPVIATHSNFRDVCAHSRNLTRDMAKEILSRKGVIGLNLYPPLLSPSGDAVLEDIFAHIDYALSAFGEDILGFGFDIDGTSGRYPLGLDESGSIHDRVAEQLTVRYGERLAAKICGENILSFLKRNI